MTALPRSVELVAVQYPGREDRICDEFSGGMAEFAAAIVSALKPIARKRMIFFGHSMGAILAFEVGRQLEHDGIRIAHLFVSAQSAPMRVRQTKFHLQDDITLLNEIRRLSGTSSEVLENGELLSIMLAAIREDYRLIENYRAEQAASANFSISLFLAHDDSEVTVDEAADWEAHTCQPLSTCYFPGGHFYLVDQWPAVVDALLKELRAGNMLSSGVVGWPSTP